MYHISNSINAEAQVLAAEKARAEGKKVALVYQDGKVEVL